MSDLELFTESETNPFSPVGSLDPVDRRRMSLGSEAESDGRSRRLNTVDKTVETFLNRSTGHRLGEKHPNCQYGTTKHVRRPATNGAACSSRDRLMSAVTNMPPEWPSEPSLGAEVKSTLKQITSLLNTVVEDELQRQRNSCPSNFKLLNPNQSRIETSTGCESEVVCICYCCSTHYVYLDVSNSYFCSLK